MKRRGDAKGAASRWEREEGRVRKAAHREGGRE